MALKYYERWILKNERDRRETIPVKDGHKDSAIHLSLVRHHHTGRPQKVYISAAKRSFDVHVSSISTLPNGQPHDRFGYWGLCSNQWRLYPGSQVRPLTGLESTRKGQGFIIQVGTFEMSPVQVSLEVWSCLRTVHWCPMKITLHVRTFLKENWKKKRRRRREHDLVAY